MELHGFDAPTTDVHSMYTPDSNDDTTTGGDSSGLDDSGGLDTGPDDGGDTIGLEINGEHYDVKATEDIDGDGEKDTAIISGGEDHKVAVMDSDGDGTADKAALIDDHGKVVDTATFDKETGEWQVQAGADSSTGTDSSDSTDSTDSSDDSGSSTDRTSAGAGADVHEGTPEDIKLEIDGQEYTRTATIDTDGDGRGDTAVIEPSSGERVTVTDTDHDGRYDESALIDDSGRVIDTMHVDPTTGEWVSGTGDHAPYAVGDTILDPAGSTSTAGTESTSATTESTSTTASTGGDSGTGTISVEAGGQVHEETATLDVNKDGVNETAVVQGADGTQVAFSDTDGDGEADQAVVFDQQGQVVGRAVFDAATGQWQNV